MTDTDAPRWRGWYEQIAPFLVVFCLITVLIVSVATFALSRSQEADRRDRERETATLLGCFDTYAAKSSAATTKVRAATVARDEADQAATRAFNRLFEFIATDPPEGSPKGLRLFLELKAASADLEAAQDGLDQARADNPVPKPPSTFCDD